MSASIRVKTSISNADPLSSGVIVAFSVIDASGILPDIFVNTYTPPLVNGQSARYVFHHVAYFDELSNYPLASNVSKQPALVLSSFMSLGCASAEKGVEAKQNIVTAISRLLAEAKAHEETLSVEDIVITDSSADIEEITLDGDVITYG